MDLGLKYTKRIEFYTSVYIVVYVSVFTVMMAQFFGFIPMLSESPLFAILAWWDIALVFLVILRVIKIGADVNQTFDDHIGLLIGLKESLFLILNDKRQLERQKFACTEMKVLVEACL